MPCPTKTIQTRYVGGFLICGYQTFAPSKNIRMLGPNTAIFAPKYAILDNRRPWPLIWCPDGWLVGCWLWRPGCSYDRASAYFMIYIMMKCLFVSDTKNEHLIKLPPSAPNVSWDLRERPKNITFWRGSVGPLWDTKIYQLLKRASWSPMSDRKSQHFLMHGRNKTQNFGSVHICRNWLIQICSKVFQSTSFEKFPKIWATIPNLRWALDAQSETWEHPKM